MKTSEFYSHDKFELSRKKQSRIIFFSKTSKTTHVWLYFIKNGFVSIIVKPA